MCLFFFLSRKIFHSSANNKEEERHRRYLLIFFRPMVCLTNCEHNRFVTLILFFSSSRRFFFLCQSEIWLTYRHNLKFDEKNFTCIAWSYLSAFFFFLPLALLYLNLRISNGCRPQIMSKRHTRAWTRHFFLSSSHCQWSSVWKCRNNVFHFVYCLEASLLVE